MNIFVIIFFLSLAFNTHAGKVNYFKSITAGVELPIDPTWKKENRISDLLGKPIGIAEIFVPTSYKDFTKLEHWRGIRVDYKNDHSTKVTSKVCPVNSNSSAKGFICLYTTTDKIKKTFYAVKKVDKIIRSPASKKEFIFTRYVTFIEEAPYTDNSNSYKNFISWLEKIKVSK